MSNYESSTRLNSSFDENNHGEELRQVQERIGQTENESLESTRRALRSLNESREIGTKTAAELVRQGEQLQAIEERLDTADHKLDDTQKQLNKLGSCCFSGLVNKFKRKRSSSTVKLSVESIKTSEFKLNGDLSVGSNVVQEPEFAKITGSDLEAELNENLGEMLLGLKHLAILGRDIGNEIDRQNPMLERLNNKAPVIQEKILDQNNQIKVILK
jgi:exonuclease VII large subunit